MVRANTSIIITLYGFLAGACTSVATAPSAVPAEVLFSSNQCSGPGVPALSRITDEQSLRALTDAEPRLQLDAPQTAGSEFPAPATAWLLRVDMGEHPTAGYAFKVQRTERAQGVLTIHVDWQEPPPEAMTAQVITHPCVVLRVPRLDITKVRVLDQNGRARMEMAVNP